MAIIGFPRGPQNIRLLIPVFRLRRESGRTIQFHTPHSAADRALKLAEVGKPKSNWELQGVLGVAAFALGVLIGK